jgi:hypothetical protein
LTRSAHLSADLFHTVTSKPWYMKSGIQGGGLEGVRVCRVGIWGLRKWRLGCGAGGVEDGSTAQGVLADARVMRFESRGGGCGADGGGGKKGMMDESPLRGRQISMRSDLLGLRQHQGRGESGSLLMLRWRGKERGGECDHLVDEVQGHAPAHDANSYETKLHHDVIVPEKPGQNIHAFSHAFAGSLVGRGSRGRKAWRVLGFGLTGRGPDQAPSASRLKPPAKVRA